MTYWAAHFERAVGMRFARTGCSVSFAKKGAVVSFTSIQWDSRIDAGVQAQGYSVPTPIQERAIPPIVEGHDLMGLAQTGSGKTAAFVLPILQRLMNGPRYHVRALVLSPTRELAEQTHEVFTELGRKTGLKSVPIYGGVSIRNQIAQLKKGVDIAVACPGRLLDHLGQGTIDLSHLEVLVLDEADRMFDMGFLPDVRRIVRQLPGERQTLLFAATMPEDIRRLTREILRNPVTVQIGQAAPPETVSHALYPAPGQAAWRAIAEGRFPCFFSAGKPQPAT
jgi:ATP-dependent RNA helicase RhlE